MLRKKWRGKEYEYDEEILHFKNLPYISPEETVEFTDQ